MEHTISPEVTKAAQTIIANNGTDPAPTVEEYLNARYDEVDASYVQQVFGKQVEVVADKFKQATKEVQDKVLADLKAAVPDVAVDAAAVVKP